MKCELCNKAEATVHLTQATPEKVLSKVDLCEACAKENGINDPTGFSLLRIIEKVKARERGNPD